MPRHKTISLNRYQILILWSLLTTYESSLELINEDTALDIDTIEKVVKDLVARGYIEYGTQNKRGERILAFVPSYRRDDTESVEP